MNQFPRDEDGQLIAYAWPARLRIQAEHEGDLLGRELLLDPDFRREFVELARAVAQEALADLRARRESR